MSEMTPREIVQELDKHIVGQDEAKRAVSIALRNRWRRMNVDEALRAEITPKNILMIGPTGVGKTEIARRLAKLANAPFLKVEATKFTEVGYVGRDVESIIRDLVDVSVKQMRESELDRVKALAEAVRTRQWRGAGNQPITETVADPGFEETADLFGESADAVDGWPTVFLAARPTQFGTGIEIELHRCALPVGKGST